MSSATARPARVEGSHDAPSAALTQDALPAENAAVESDADASFVPDAAPRARGRPRSDAARRAILAAARGLLDEGGPSAVTMEAVAARAGVGKPTVYRWWPNRHAVAMAALMDAPQVGDGAARSVSPLQALRAQLLAVVETFVSRVGRNAAAMIASADSETEISKAFRNHFVLARREEGRVLLQQAVVAGEVRADVQVDVVLDLLYGPLFFRLLMGHAPLDAAFAEVVFGDVVRGVGAGVDGTGSAAGSRATPIPTLPPSRGKG